MLKLFVFPVKVSLLFVLLMQNNVCVLCHHHHHKGKYFIRINTHKKKICEIVIKSQFHMNEKCWTNSYIMYNLYNEEKEPEKEGWRRREMRCVGVGVMSGCNEITL